MPSKHVVKKTKREKVGAIFVVLVLFATYPFVFNRFLPIPSIMVVMLFTIIVFIVAGVLKRVYVSRPLIPIAIILTLGTIISMIATKDIGYNKQLLYIWWGVIMVSFIDSIGLKKFLYLYNRMFLFIAILGVASFFLSFVLGGRTYLEFEGMDGRPGYLIYFTFTNSKMGNFIRYAGVFDEPGAMATWGMYSLLLNKIYVKDRVIEKPLIICLLFTFSIAYLIELSLYFYFFYFRNTPFSTKFYTFLILGALIGSFFMFIEKDSPVYLLTLGRLGIGSSTDFFEANNRVRMMEVAKKLFHESPFFGVGTTSFYGGDYAADNPYETLAKDGVIGTLFIYFPLIKALTFARKNMEIFYMVAILAVGYLQRPFHINILHYTMLFIVYLVSYKLCKTNRVLTVTRNTTKSVTRPRHKSNKRTTKSVTKVPQKR